MEAIIEPGKLHGALAAPASKSMMQRTCAAALLHCGKTIIGNPGGADDDKAALNIIKQLGAEVNIISKDNLEILSTGIIRDISEIDCRESGLAARLFAPIAALSGEPIVLMGHGSLLHRSMHSFSEIFSALEVLLPGFPGTIPFTVLGPLKAKNVFIDGSLSSQFLTGILLVLAAAAKEPVTIDVRNLKSKPYIDLTLQVLELFGKKIVHDQYRYFHIDPSKFILKKEVAIHIESDWSSASYWLVGAAISGDVTLQNLSVASLQADKKIMEVLKIIGCNISVGAEINIAFATLKAFRFDATDCPDLFPILSVLAAYCEGVTEIKGLHRLVHKESDRVKSIQEMLQQFGVSFYVKEDSLFITGQKELNAAAINGYNDHRIVMAAAIGALRAKDAVTIYGAEAVSKSYPRFFEDLSSLNILSVLKQ